MPKENCTFLARVLAGDVGAAAGRKRGTVKQKKNGARVADSIVRVTPTGGMKVDLEDVLRSKGAAERLDRLRALREMYWPTQAPRARRRQERV